jgi:hypothetical protein
MSPGLLSPPLVNSGLIERLKWINHFDQASSENDQLSFSTVLLQGCHGGTSDGCDFQLIESKSLFGRETV